jgi:RNA binding exosome subunit
MSHQLRETLEQALRNLETGVDLTRNHAEVIHASYKGYYPERHAAADHDVTDMEAAVAAVTEALDSMEAPARELTKERLEEMAHRRCRRYIHIDTEAPYHFDGNTLTDLARDIIAAMKEPRI